MSRKNLFKKFYVDKFKEEVKEVKNWILEAFKYSLAIVLEKSKLNFNFFTDTSSTVKNEKQKLIMHVL